MDILYIVGKGSTWANNELKYSLRSIAKNGVNVGKIFIIGYIPLFVNRDEVTCIPLEDLTNVKHYNIVKAIDYAIKNTDIGENFLYSSDDHFYIKPTDFDNYPIFYKGHLLPEKYPEHKHDNKYYTTLISTRKLLDEYNLPYCQFNWHGNTHFNTRLWKSDKLLEIIEKSYTMPEGCDPTCLMLNYLLLAEPFEYIIRADKKIKGFDSKETFKEVTKDRECISSAPNIRNSYMGNWLKKHFPDKCKYEI